MSLRFPAPGTGDPFYALEKLAVADQELDRQDDSPKALLYNAALEVQKIASRDMPKGELRWAFAAIKRELTGQRQQNAGIIATIAAMTESDCAAMSRRIRLLYLALDAHLDKA